MIQPFWLGQELASCLRELQPGDPVSFSPATLRRLFMAGIVVPEDYVEDRKQAWSARLERISQGYRQKLYAPMRSVLHPFQVSALRRYFRHRISATNRVPAASLLTTRACCGFFIIN
jgi:hypothetical protein